jgi:hypothetical protein
MLYSNVEFQGFKAWLTILPGFDRLVRLRLVDFSHPLQCVNLADWLIIANAQNAREAQGEAAIVPV